MMTAKLQIVYAKRGVPWRLVLPLGALLFLAKLLFDTTNRAY